jgi:hypothetical protein
LDPKTLQNARNLKSLDTTFGRKEMNDESEME